MFDGTHTLTKHRDVFVEIPSTKLVSIIFFFGFVGTSTKLAKRVMEEDKFGQGTVNADSSILK